MTSPQFTTDFTYHDRKSKSEYVWKKYRPILAGKSILDVGADEQHLKQYLPDDTQYTGIGLGGNPDKVVNLEKSPIPFDDNHFDTVLCLDVLEHVDNIHAVYDELCRVAKQHVIISLPSPWSDFYSMMHKGDYSPGKHMKYYGLPKEPPEDRHKWFFSFDEAKDFIYHRAEKNGLSVIQFDYIGGETQQVATWRKVLKQLLSIKPPFRTDLDSRNFYARSVWAVLEK